MTWTWPRPPHLLSQHLPRRGPRRVPRLETLGDRVAPAVLTVGPGQTYALPSQAAAAAHDGDTIDIYADGNYQGDTCRWTQNNLTIQGVGGGRARIDITAHTAYGDKAVWVIDGSNTTVNNVELSGAHDTLGTGNNWAGIRLEGNTLTLSNDYFHNDDDGILVNATNTGLGPTSNVAVYGSEFAFNGWGDGYSHNMYVGAVTSFTLENSYSHDANQGHLVKSRALTNYVLYNRLEDGAAAASTASYELDLPQGGTSYVVGNLIEQGPHSANPTIITYAEEGALNPGESLYLVNNTVVNDRGGGTFVNVAAGATALLENNIFAGPGTVAAGAGGVTQVTNLASNNPGFVNQAGHDYHLTTGSPAINAGTTPGTAGGFNLTPTSQYVDPLSLQPRPPDGHIDIGAYEYVAPAAQIDVSAPATVTAGVPFPITVTIRDAGHNRVTGYTGTVHFVASDGATADYTFTAADMGQHTFTVTTYRAQTLSVTGNDAAARISGSATFTVVAAAADHIRFDVPAGVTAGVSFPITVTIQDAYNNTVTGYLGTVHFTASNGAMADYAFQPADLGRRVFNVVVPQPQTLTVTGTDQSAGISGSITFTINSPGPSGSGGAAAAPAAGPAGGGAPPDAAGTTRTRTRTDYLDELFAAPGRRSNRNVRSLAGRQVPQAASAVAPDGPVSEFGGEGSGLR